MEQQNGTMPKRSLPERPELITKDLVKSVFSLELSADNYQKLLQDAENIVFTRDNLSQDYSCLKLLRDIKNKLEKLKDAKKRPFIDANSAIQDAFKELNAPIDDVLKRKTEEFAKINNEIKAENLKIEQERQRELEIQQSITTFINNTTTLITNATTDSEIVRIQKAIGSEKARVSFYGEYMPKLKSACDNLTPLINGRKAFIREADSLMKEQEEALAVGDIQKATDILEKKELLEAEMAENKIRMQEKAFEQAVDIEVVIPESMSEAVKPRRTSWKWQVEDIQMLQKKMPHLVELVPNKERIQELLALKKSDGSLNNIEELKLFGLTIYLEKIY